MLIQQRQKEYIVVYCRLGWGNDRATPNSQ